MKGNLSITLVQCSLSWENAAANRASIESLLSNHHKDSDIIVVPEMFTTGFSMNANELAEEMHGESHMWLKNLAKRHDSTIIGSLIIQESGNYYNRLLVVSPSGDTEHYDKRHLFSFAGEDKHFTSGQNRLIIDCHGWRICPLICYDLRFPIWSRNASLDGQSAINEYDILIYIANWPNVRNKPWKNLLEARAHENQSFVVGVNRIGKDGNNIDYSGDSAVYSPKGEKITVIAPNEISVQTVQLRRDELQSFREKFPVGKDKDQFILNR